MKKSLALLFSILLLCVLFVLPGAAETANDFRPGEVNTEENYALEATVTASRYMDNAGLRKALSFVNNGSAHDEGWVTFTNWGEEQWIQLTLKEAAEINTVVCWPRSTMDDNRNSCFPRRFKLLVQLEDNSWKTVLDYSEQKWSMPPSDAEPIPQVMEFDTVTAKAIKLECTDSYPPPSDLGGEDGPPVYWIEEIGIYKVARAAATTTVAPTTTTVAENDGTTTAQATSTTQSTTTATQSVFSGDDTPDDADNEGLPTGAIVGIVIGCVVIAGGVVVMLLLLKKRRAN